MILAATPTLFHQEGIGVSTGRIARATGVSNRTLFNYFPTKQVLIDALHACSAWRRTSPDRWHGRMADGNRPSQRRARRTQRQEWAKQQRALHPATEASLDS
jgi:hypothetical protein